MYKFVVTYESLGSSRAEARSQFTLPLIKMSKVLRHTKKLPVKTQSPRIDQPTPTHGKAKASARLLAGTTSYIFQVEKSVQPKLSPLSPQTGLSLTSKEWDLLSRKKMKAFTSL